MTSDGTNTYTWNARNQLASIAGNTTDSFEYDPFGRRLQKTMSGATTDFLYDGVNPVQEISGGTVDANMLTGLNVDEYFQRADLLGTWDYLDDPLGSTLALADASGTVQTQYTYSLFGSTTTQGQASSNSYQFTGRENDSDGLYSYRARYYDPMLSRFISEDPFEIAGGQVDLYEYAADNPTEMVDPSGRELVAAIVGLIGAGTGALDQGIQAYNCGKRGWAVVGAAGRGALAGGAGAVAGLAAGFYSGNVYAGGAAGGAVYNYVNDALRRGRFWGTGFGSDIAGGAALGAALGGLGEDLVPNGPGGWNFNPFKSPRTFGAKALQEYTRDAIAGAAGLGVGAAANAMAGTNCGCH